MCGCVVVVSIFVFKQKTAYEVRISDWSSDVGSSDLYLDITVQVGVVGLAVALGFLLLFFWRAAALLKFDRAPIAALPMFFRAFIMAYSLSEYALFRQHSLIQLLLDRKSTRLNSSH